MVTRHHMRPLNLHQLKKVSDRAQFRLLRDLDGAVLDTLVVACADALATRALPLSPEIRSLPS